MIHAQAQRVENIEHRQRQILYVDLSHCSRSQMSGCKDELVMRLNTLPEGVKVTVLMNLEASPVDLKLLTEFKGHLDILKARVRRSALIGLSPMMLSSLRGIKATADLLGLSLGPERAVPFPDKDSALDWLAS